MISIILPAYNEEKNIQRTVDSILNFLLEINLVFEIIVINDGSQDGTGNVLENYQSYKNIIVVSHDKNLGYGAALRSGFNQAKGDLIFFTDSDGQFSIDDLDPFLEKINQYDFIIGYRKNRQDSSLRIFNAALFNFVAKMLFDIKVKDIDCAFKLFKKEVIKSLSLQENGALINLEILALTKKSGYKFLELPVNHFARTSGKPTGGSSKVIFKAMFCLFILWKRVYKNLR